MKQKLIIIWKWLIPYKSILLFLFLLFLFHFSWKLTIDGDRDDEFMYFLGKDVTPEWFHTACLWLTSATAWFIRLFPEGQDLIINRIYMSFPVNAGWSIRIIWGCTGIKQMSIFCGIMLFYKCYPFLKYQWHKLWYVPVGCIVLTAYNIIRIGSTVLLTKGHPEKFDSLHDGIFRYIYYGIVFVLWMIWEERFAKKNEEINYDNSSNTTAS
jgi:exosortase/archaeosortase family protein